MREIKFRGRVIAPNEHYKVGDWVYGDLLLRHYHDGGYAYISYFFNEYHGGIVAVETVNQFGNGKDTIGQFTGLYDKNGKEIYEGDIVKCHQFFTNYDPSTYGAVEDEVEFTGIVRITEYGTAVESLQDTIIHNKEDFYYLFDFIQEITEEIEVIGNIHEGENL